MAIEEQDPRPTARQLGEDRQGHGALVALNWMALVCATLVAMFSLWGWVVVRRGDHWIRAGGDSGEDITVPPLALGIGIVAFVGAAGRLGGERGGTRSDRWSWVATLATFAYAVLGLEGYTDADWTAVAASWAGMGGLVAAMAGLWLVERERGTAPGAAALRLVGAALLSLLGLFAVLIGVSLLGILDRLDSVRWMRVLPIPELVVLTVLFIGTVLALRIGPFRSRGEPTVGRAGAPPGGR